MAKKPAKKTTAVVKTDSKTGRGGFTFDGWTNILTNIGVEGKDKRTGLRMRPKFLTQVEVENIYQGDDIAAKVIDRMPEEMVREGFEVTTKDKGFDDITQATDDWFKKYNLHSKIEQGIKWARLYGGAGMIVGVQDDQDPSMPVNFKNISAVEYLTTLHRYDFKIPSSMSLDKNVASPNFKKPAYYELANNLTYNQAKKVENKPTSQIHHSRVIRFEGVPVEGTYAAQVGYWGDSILSRLYNAITNYQASHDSAAVVMQDVVKLIVKLKNLSDMIAQGDDNLVTERLRLLAKTTSVINAIVIQDGEECESRTTQLTGVPEMLEMVNDRLVAATDMPHTILLGEGATGGIGNKGESEKRDWYDQVKNRQESYLRPIVEKILKLAYAAKDGPTGGRVPERFIVKFKPLWLPSEKEIAETRKIVAETDKIYQEIGVLDEDEIANSRFGSGEYSMETKIDATMRSEVSNGESEDNDEEDETA